MKKILLFIVLVIAIVIISDELSFDPLSKDDLHKLFSDYSETPKMIMKNDFIGLSIHGEIFDMYCYMINNVKLNSNNFMISSWENKPIDNNTLIKSWKKTPIDLLDMKKNDMLFVSNVKQKEWYKHFSNELFNSKNYYSYIYVDEDEQYFLLYVSHTKELYYFRKKRI